ncbi:hypothetical protein ACJMK2_000988 [Sinanodonta woodiana]|uniref:Uncharacterized protein n=1 Tax=Sinanodonta woodiana TaxID=1069815 RepID=A0ABD3XUC4_SINWO
MATERQMIKEYRAMGSKYLGYEGDRLAAFIEERIKEWKAEKAGEREKELAKIAADRELELTKIAADRELAKIAAEQEIARLAHNLEMEKVRVEARTNGRDDAGTSSGTNGRPFIDHRMV